MVADPGRNTAMDVSRLSFALVLQADHIVQRVYNQLVGVTFR